MKTAIVFILLTIALVSAGNYASGELVKGCQVDKCLKCAANDIMVIEYLIIFLNLLKKKFLLIKSCEVCSDNYIALGGQCNLMKACNVIFIYACKTTPNINKKLILFRTHIVEFVYQIQAFVIYVKKDF
jgi:hypothetical protein